MRTTLLLLVTVGLAGAQKLETHTPDSTRVVSVQTARDHLTVIELADPVTMVAVGNRSAFTVERRENKVFVTPTDEAAQTNLFIWTTGGRYAYELLPAKSVDETHFAIDQTAIVTTASVPVTEQPEVIPAAMLTEARPVTVAGARDTAGRVAVTIRDVYRSGRRLYLRYAVTNDTGAAYRPGRPAVWRLEEPLAQRSLITLTGRQLGERIARTLRTSGETPLEVVDAGSREMGWLAIDEPPSTGDVAVYKVRFAADSKGIVDAVIVLAPPTASEVARVRPAGE